MSDSPRRGLIAAAIAFTISLFVFGNALVRAVGTEEGAPVDSAVDDRLAAPPSEVNEPLSTEALMLALDNDPFQPTRDRPAERYRLPGDVDPEPPPAPSAPPPLPPFMLHGTIVAAVPEQSSALIQLGEAPPVLLPVGGSIAGFRVAEVQREAVIMTDGERQVWLRVPGPQQMVAAAPEPSRRGRESTRVRGSPPPPSAETRGQLMQLMQQLQAARQGGAPPEVLQAIEQAIERTASQGGGNVRIRAREVPVRRAVPDSMSTGAPRAPDLH